jgi:hypothetical protein
MVIVLARTTLKDHVIVKPQNEQEETVGLAREMSIAVQRRMALVLAYFLTNLT